MKNFSFKNALNHLFGNHSNSTSNTKNKNKRNRTLRIEELEGRDLLSASPFGNDYGDSHVLGNNLYESDLIYHNGQNSAGIQQTSAPIQATSAPIAAAAAVNSFSQNDFNTIRTKYADLGLTANVGDYHVIEIAANELSDNALRSAINTATTNGLNNLIVVHTTSIQNTITLNDGQLGFIGTGNVTIVSQGTDNLTIDANNRSRVICTVDAVQVHLAGLTIKGGYVDSGAIGGGICNGSTGAIMKIAQCRIEGNIAGPSSSGGGIANVGKLTITNSIVTGNTAYDNGGGIANGGEIMITNGIITGNEAFIDGGGIFSSGSMSLTGIEITKNTANRSGGGISINSAYGGVTRCTITGNTANSNGGGIQSNGLLEMASSVIAGNRTGSGTTGYGGGIYNEGTAGIWACTIAGNFAYGYGGGTYTSGDTRIIGSIVAYNIRTSNTMSDVMTAKNNNSITGVSYSLIRYVTPEGTNNKPFVEDWGNNILPPQGSSTINPRFVKIPSISETTTGAGYTAANWDLRLQSDSPAIDKGYDEFAWMVSDIDSKPRRIGARIDMGAYEHGVIAIQNLHVTAQSATSVSLSWDAQHDVTDYKLEYRVSGGTWKTWSSPGKSATSATVGNATTPLSAGTTYDFRLTANGHGGPVSSMTTVTLLPVPTLGNVTPFTTTSINVVWNAVSNASGYTIQWATNSTFTTGVGTADSSTNSIVIADLTLGTKYFVRVMALGNGTTTCNSGWSEAMNTTPGATLTTPKSVSAEPAKDGTISVKWTAVANASGYKIEYSTDKTFATDTTTVESSTASTILTVLPVNTKYYVRVKAINTGYIDSSWSATKQVTTKKPPGNGYNPMKASGIKKTDIMLTSFKISWKDTPKNTFYTIKCTSHSGIDISDIEIVNGRPTVEVTGLNPGTTYKFTITSYNGETSAKSAAKISVKTKTYNAPTGIKKAVTSSSITLTWKAHPYPETTHYEVYNPVTGAILGTIPVSSTTGTVVAWTYDNDGLGLFPSTTYKFQIVAVSDLLDGMKSKVAKVSAKTKK